MHVDDDGARKRPGMEGGIVGGHVKALEIKCRLIMCVRCLVVDDLMAALYFVLTCVLVDSFVLQV